MPPKVSWADTVRFGGGHGGAAKTGSAWTGTNGGSNGGRQPTWRCGSCGLVGNWFSRSHCRGCAGAPPAAVRKMQLGRGKRQGQTGQPSQDQEYAAALEVVRARAEAANDQNLGKVAKDAKEALAQGAGKGATRAGGPQLYGKHSKKPWASSKRFKLSARRPRSAPLGPQVRGRQAQGGGQGTKIAGRGDEAARGHAQAQGSGPQ